MLVQSGRITTRHDEIAGACHASENRRFESVKYNHDLISPVKFRLFESSDPLDHARNLFAISGIALSHASVIVSRALASQRRFEEIIRIVH